MYVHKKPNLRHLHSLIQHHQQRQECHRPAQLRQVLGLHTIIRYPLDGQGLQETNQSRCRQEQTGQDKSLRVRVQIRKNAPDSMLILIAHCFISQKCFPRFFLLAIASPAAAKNFTAK